MNRALLLSPFFYPEVISTGKYNTYLVEELVRQGYDVDVWCSHPIYPSWVVSVSDSCMHGVHIVRGGRYNWYPKNPLIRRAVLEVWYAIFVLRNLLKKRGEYDLVVPVFPPSFFSLLVPLFGRRGSKVVGIVHDLQGVFAGKRGGLFNKALLKLIFSVERRGFSNCDHLIYLSESMREKGNRVYAIDPSKTSVFYPFITVEKFYNSGRLSSTIKTGEKALVYSGALGEKQNGDELMKLFHLVLTKDDGALAHVFSCGQIFEDLKKKYSSKRLRFHGLVDEEDLSELLIRSKVHVVPQMSGSSCGSLPSKIPNLLASGVGVFCITDEGSELSKIIDEHPFGRSVANWDIEQNAEILVDMLNTQHRKAVNFSLLSRFKRESLVKKMMKICEG